MHILFQRHHITPDEYLAKPRWVQAFLKQSMLITLEAEDKHRKELEAKRNKK